MTKQGRRSAIKQEMVDLWLTGYFIYWIWDTVPSMFKAMNLPNVWLLKIKEVRENGALRHGTSMSETPKSKKMNKS